MDIQDTSERTDNKNIMNDIIEQIKTLLTGVLGWISIVLFIIMLGMFAKMFVWDGMFNAGWGETSGRYHNPNQETSIYPW